MRPQSALPRESIWISAIPLRKSCAMTLTGLVAIDELRRDGGAPRTT
jgi:hypothetical protein